MQSRSRGLVVLAAAVALALSACSTTTSQAPEGSTVELQADYPAYDTATLFEEATLIVEGTALATEATVLTPRYEGDTPEENPLLGLSEEEIRRAMAQDEGIPATAVTFRVDAVHQGSVEPGDEITVIQTGGVVDGVTYLAVHEPLLVTGESYLLFVADGFDGAFAILGGSAGTYLSSGNGVFTAVNPEAAPSAGFTLAEVNSLSE